MNECIQGADSLIAKMPILKLILNIKGMQIDVYDEKFNN